MIGSQNAIVVDVVTGFCNRPAVGLSIPPHTRLCVTHHQSSGDCKSIMPIVPCVLYRSSYPRHRPDAMLAEGWRTNLCISFLQPVQFWTNLFDAMNGNVTAPSARRPNLNLIRLQFLIIPSSGNESYEATHEGICLEWRKHLGVITGK